jgi:predicted nucleic-acid-binding protein
MRYIDTNVLVRIITGDDPFLATKAIEEIEGGSPGDFCLVDAILVELCFVLEFHSYAMERDAIVDALETLIASPQIMVSRETPQALAYFRKHPKLDYADCLLVILGGNNGVLTFDKDLQRVLSLS